MTNTVDFILIGFVGANSCAENSEGSKRSKKVLTILQWNIQGLLDTCIKERTVAVVQEIKRWFLLLFDYGIKLLCTYSGKRTPMQKIVNFCL